MKLCNWVRKVTHTYNMLNTSFWQKCNLKINVIPCKFGTHVPQIYNRNLIINKFNFVYYTENLITETFKRILQSWFSCDAYETKQILVQVIRKFVIILEIFFLYTKFCLIPDLLNFLMDVQCL